MRLAEWGAALRSLERTLLPGACLICNNSVAARDDDALICSLCRSRWSPVPPPWCVRCGQPLLGQLACRICAEWPDGLGMVRSAVWLRHGARRAVHCLKYEGWRRAAHPMARAMTALEPLTDSVVLVPVPLGAARRRQRGYNQAEELARAVALRRGLSVEPGLVSRARETPTQTALTPEARHANMRNAFVAGAAARGRAVVLVDDVFTTGATLAAVAAALHLAGATSVAAVTFARAPLPVST